MFDGTDLEITSIRSTRPRPSTFSMTWDASPKARPKARADSVSPGPMRLTNAKPVKIDRKPVRK